MQQLITTNLPATNICSYLITKINILSKDYISRLEVNVAVCDE